MPSPKQPNPLRFLGVGLELGGVVAVMAWLGWSFDRWQGTEPWGVIVGSSIGIIGGLYRLVRDATRVK